MLIIRGWTLGMLYKGSRDRRRDSRIYWVWHRRKDIASHQCTIGYLMLARQSSELGLNIDGAGWYRLMYIHRHLDLFNLADASVICLSSSVGRNVGPPFLSMLDFSLAPSVTKNEKGSLITTSDAARIVEFSYLLRFSLSCQVPVLAASP